MNKHATRLLTGAALAAIPLAGTGTAQADTLHPDPVGEALGNPRRNDPGHPRRSVPSPEDQYP